MVHGHIVSGPHYGGTGARGWLVSPTCVAAVTDEPRSTHGRRWLARRLRARNTSSPERDELEAQEYWRRRFREHPDELERAAPMREPRIDRPSSDVGQPRVDKPASAPWWWWLTRWVCLAFFLLQGLATLILFVLGASPDKVGLSLVWTVLWLFFAGAPLMRFA